MQVSLETGETTMTSGVEKDGAFKGAVIIAGTMRIDVKRLPPGVYVRQVIYNGVDSGQFVPLSEDVPAWLEITLSDRPAGIIGTVTRDGKPASGDHIIVARWPAGSGLNVTVFCQRRNRRRGSIQNLGPCARDLSRGWSGTGGMGPPDRTGRRCGVVKIGA
jgi:hypothetical protein